MAAYGALVSVMQIMDQLHRHPHPPISLNKEHAESLAANVSFLQEFLEGYYPRVSYTSEADPLESRIAEAAYAAEDVIESYIVDQLCARSTDHDGGKISSTEFYQGAVPRLPFERSSCNTNVHVQRSLSKNQNSAIAKSLAMTADAKMRIHA